jgi:hypothetical protein
MSPDPNLRLTISILDIPEVMQLVEECLDAVDEWKKPELRARLDAIMERAHQRREDAGR